MKPVHHIAAALILGSVATITQAEPAGAVFPGNEAVKIVNGKRMVEAPPLTEATKRSLKSGFKLPPPGPGTEVYMIEGEDGLRECGSVYLSATGCVPSTLGTVKRARYWTVKLKGAWLHCDTRAPSRKCEPVSAGVPGGMGSLE
jgi:hypothetical protein